MITSIISNTGAASSTRTAIKWDGVSFYTTYNLIVPLPLQNTRMQGDGGWTKMVLQLAPATVGVLPYVANRYRPVLVFEYRYSVGTMLHLYSDYVGPSWAKLS